MYAFWTILAILCPIALVAVIVWLSFTWVLGPLDRAAKTRRGTFQFSIGDLLCLFVLIQLPFGAVHWRLAGENVQQEIRLGFSLLTVGVAVVAWLAGVQLLSKAQIHVPWQRSVALAVVMPLAVFGNFALIAMPIVAMTMLEQGQTSRACWLLIAEVLLCCVIYGCGRFTRMIVAVVKEQTVKHDDEEPSA
jgi:hypothetical protein